MVQPESQSLTSLISILGNTTQDRYGDLRSFCPMLFSLCLDTIGLDSEKYSHFAFFLLKYRT